MSCTEKAVRTALNELADPRSGDNLLSTGIVENVTIEAENVSITLQNPGHEDFEHQALAGAIKRQLQPLEGVQSVSVAWEKPTRAQMPVHHGRDGIALNVLSDTDTCMGTGVAKDIGYGEFGPDQILSPEMDIPNEAWEGYPPVMQWDIDPTNTEYESGEATVSLLDWQFEIWWQIHPSELMYVAIQAMHEDEINEDNERKHPVGRNVVVNLVFDQKREAIISVYGTARDFRPFIEAFQVACDIPIPEGCEQVTTTKPKQEKSNA
ncbi:MAG: iron-sulfur cluster assembly protein [Phycisphaerae bacterium]|jgi:metal-sulfur cluster biosynthetic enzyme|nr:iron-sulfur cluster assembly protein [Phycisphaerae bacterium]